MNWLFFLIVFIIIIVLAFIGYEVYKNYYTGSHEKKVFESIDKFKNNKITEESLGKKLDKITAKVNKYTEDISLDNIDSSFIKDKLTDLAEASNKFNKKITTKDEPSESF